MGYMELRNAIYKQCALDYKEALKMGNVARITECERFLLSGAYGLSIETGKAIVEGIRNEVEEWEVKKPLKTRLRSS